MCRWIEAGSLIPFGVWVAAGKVEGPRCRSIVLKRARRGIVVWYEIGQKRLLQRNELVSIVGIEYVIILRVDKDCLEEDQEEACGGPYAHHILIGTSHHGVHTIGGSPVRGARAELGRRCVLPK